MAIERVVKDKLLDSGGLADGKLTADNKAERRLPTNQNIVVD